MVIALEPSAISRLLSLTPSATNCIKIESKSIVAGVKRCIFLRKLISLMEPSLALPQRMSSSRDTQNPSSCLPKSSSTSLNYWDSVQLANVGLNFTNLSHLVSQTLRDGKSVLIKKLRVEKALKLDSKVSKALLVTRIISVCHPRSEGETLRVGIQGSKIDKLILI